MTAPGGGSSGQIDSFRRLPQEFEDGTNIVFGTSFREGFATRVLPWYIPSEAKGSLAWKENLTTLRTRFNNFIDQHCATECFLIQTLIPQIGEVAHKPPGTLPDRQFLCSGPGLRKEPTKLFGIQKPLVAAFTMLNVRSEPLLETDGKPLPFKLGLNRYFTASAIPDGLRTLPIPKFTELLTDGKNALFQLPSKIAVEVWRNWSSGFSQKDSNYLWLDAVFELAWRCQKGSSFHSERYAWFENASIFLTGKGLFPRLPKFVTATPGEFCPHENGYPRSFYSKISDVARSSIAAIDEILELDALPLHISPTKIGEDMKTISKAQVFISYSHKDKKFLDDLLIHLKPIERVGRLSSWSDKQIQPGSKWFDEIQAALSRAKVAVLLVSPSFLASEFIHEHELTPLLKRAAEEGVQILWIPVRASSYKESAIQKYQAVISPDKPLAEMKAERDKAWVRICEEIQKAIAK